jgi:hypothetical protein
MEVEILGGRICFRSAKPPNTLLFYWVSLFSYTAVKLDGLTGNGGGVLKCHMQVFRVGTDVTLNLQNGRGSNDANLNEGGRTTAVSLVGAHPDQGSRWGTALGHLLVVLPGNVSLQVWIGMTKWD